MSRQDSRRRRRATKRSRPADVYTLLEIAERDRFKCGLCRRRVDMALPFPHVKAPTIDHILPLSVGGDDTRANIQLAHFGCNAGKGPRGAQQLALIG